MDWMLPSFWYSSDSWKWQFSYSTRDFKNTEGFSALDRVFSIFQEVVQVFPHDIKFFLTHNLHAVHYIFLRYLLLLEYKERLNSYQRIHAHVDVHWKKVTELPITTEKVDVRRLVVCLKNSALSIKNFILPVNVRLNHFSFTFLDFGEIGPRLYDKICISLDNFFFQTRRLRFPDEKGWI